MKRGIIIVMVGLLVLLAGGVIGYATLHFTRQPSATHTSDTGTSTMKPKPDPLTCVAKLPVTERIGQKLMAAGYVSQLADETSIFANASLGGIIMMNEVPSDQIAAFREAMPLTPFIAVDQEGGTVQRYKNAGILPGATQMVANGSANAAYQQYLTDNQYLKTSGITTNFAPVVDVISREPVPLPGRMYSTDPSIVTDYTTANIKAAQAAGITPVIKHFPGLGSATGNTDFTAATTDPLETLMSRDLVPYKNLASLHPDVMVGNMVVPDLTNGQPAVWSKKAIDLLRSLGYKDAVVYTDSLTANAIPGALDDAVIKTWQAGTDVALIVQDSTDTANLAGYLQTIAAKAEAAIKSKEIDTNTFDASVLRILTRKHIDPCALQPNQ